MVEAAVRGSDCVLVLCSAGHHCRVPKIETEALLAGSLYLDPGRQTGGLGYAAAAARVGRDLRAAPARVGRDHRAVPARTRGDLFASYRCPSASCYRRAVYHLDRDCDGRAGHAHARAPAARRGHGRGRRRAVSTSSTSAQLPKPTPRLRGPLDAARFGGRFPPSVDHDNDVTHLGLCSASRPQEAVRAHSQAIARDRHARGRDVHGIYHNTFMRTQGQRSRGLLLLLGLVDGRDELDNGFDRRLAADGLSRLDTR